MKDSLDKLTVNQFIDLVCGDTSVLLNKREVASPIKLALAMRNIIFEYKEIADPGGSVAYISRTEDFIKARIAVVVFLICNNLMAINEVERVREILVDYGLNTDAMNEQRLRAEVKSRLARAKNTIASFENETENRTVEIGEVRHEFDAQTAALMAYYKFQIDPATMKATVYAHLIARHNREIKDHIAATRKK